MKLGSRKYIEGLVSHWLLPLDGISLYILTVDVRSSFGFGNFNIDGYHTALKPSAWLCLELGPHLLSRAARIEHDASSREAKVRMPTGQRRKNRIEYGHQRSVLRREPGGMHRVLP